MSLLGYWVAWVIELIKILSKAQNGNIILKKPFCLKACGLFYFKYISVLCFKLDLWKSGFDYTDIVKRDGDFFLPHAHKLTGNI